MKIIIHVGMIRGGDFRKACRMAEIELAKDVLKDTAEFVPALTGVFSNAARTRKNEVIYTGDQVNYLYNGKVMVDEQDRHAVFYEGIGWRHRKGARLHATEKDLVFTTNMHPNAQSHWMEASYEKNAEKWARESESEVLKFL